MLAFFLCLISVARELLALLKSNSDRRVNAMVEPRSDDTLIELRNNAVNGKTLAEDEEEEFIDDHELAPSTTTSNGKRSRKISDVIDSVREFTHNQPGHSTPRQRKAMQLDLVSPDQGYGDTPGHETSIIPEWMHRRSDHIDATPPGVVTVEYEVHNGTPSGITAHMPVTKTAERYNMSHKNRGKCLVFNHEIFETGFSNREGSTVDAKRIQATFTTLGFDVSVHDNLEHSEVLDEIKKLSGADHTDNDCVCVFILTHGMNNDLLMAKDAAYRSDKIWKPFTADKCPTLAGKPKLFFFQACRGDKLDGGITLMSRSGNTQTDSAVASYKIPTHSDFLIAHSSAEDAGITLMSSSGNAQNQTDSAVASSKISPHSDFLIAHSCAEGFFSWRNPQEGTWYIQCLCSVLEQFSATTDLLRMLTITARRVATEFQSYDDMNAKKNEQKQVPSSTSMLIRDLYFTPK